ncbi:DUF4262 domain-containing protein [Micromonospora sp. C28SCA-DRY-2]|uniref:DUF4262 domain-containing protein n=1 Tax=Micromonospora sp. C28SCA-DRY-2 TaxID=3059522 RepID=UPI0034A0772A
MNQAVSPCHRILCHEYGDTDDRHPTELTTIGHVQQHGWSVVTIPDDDKGPGWAYTIGLWHTGFIGTGTAKTTCTNGSLSSGSGLRITRPASGRRISESSSRMCQARPRRPAQVAQTSLHPSLVSRPPCVGLSLDRSGLDMSSGAAVAATLTAPPSGAFGEFPPNGMSGPSTSRKSKGRSAPAVTVAR